MRAKNPKTPYIMKNFKVLLPDGTAINERTKFTINGKPSPITNEADLCKLLKRIWRKETNSKSFTEWAESLNNTGEYEGTFTKYDALDNLSSMFQININGEHVHAYDLFTKHLPFTNN